MSEWVENGIYDSSFVNIKYWVNGSFNTVQGAIEVFTIQINIEFNVVVGKALKEVTKIDSKLYCELKCFFTTTYNYVTFLDLWLYFVFNIAIDFQNVFVS